MGNPPGRGGVRINRGPPRRTDPDLPSKVDLRVLEYGPQTRTPCKPIVSLYAGPMCHASLGNPLDPKFSRRYPHDSGAYVSAMDVLGHFGFV